MSHIKAYRQHGLGLEGARRAAEEIAAHLDERFDLSYRWEGHSLHFKRSGIDGHLNVTDTEVSVEARLGLLMMAFKPALEREVNRYLDEALQKA
jgi:putative polyhydroxyalkanoate system protein